LPVEPDDDAAGARLAAMSDRNHETGDGLLDDDPLVPTVIVCVDCGGRAHLLTIVTDEQPLLPGDVATYRCEDCRDRWDLIVPGADDDDW
jgi:hypothetical protein